MSQSQQTKLEQAAGASLFGQFRSSMSDFLWLKVDKYLHNGVDLRGTTRLEKEAHAAELVANSKNGLNDGNREHHDETTVVPTPKSDWRGVYGAWEREIQPFTNMSAHEHRDPREALPLFRLMTAANPNFIAGYVTGASMIARDRTKLAEAVAFLEEGAHNNPYNHEIQQALGMMYTGKMRRLREGEPYLIRAIQFAAKREFATMNEDEIDAYRNAFRWLILNRREAKRLDQAREVATFGLRVFPTDPLCQKYSRMQTTEKSVAAAQPNATKE